MVPILLRSFGRSGSTLVMQLLGTSPNIIFDREYPYEKRHLTYLYRLALLPGKEVNNDGLWNTESLIHKGVDRVGPLPFNTSIINRGKLGADLFMGLWNGLSENILRRHKDRHGVEKPVYYAEKVAMDICADLNSIIEANNILLLRDPRDEMVSIKCFNEKRGSDGFGWGKDEDDVAFARKLCKMRKGHITHFLRAPESARVIKIQYENLISDPYTETKRMGDWLELELSYDETVKNRESHSDHITSPSPEKSTKRWKNELSKEVIDIFDKELGAELSQLGY